MKTPSASLAHSLAVIWRALTAAQRRRFLVLQFMSVLMALSTVMGLAAVLAFFAVLANPALIESHPVLTWLLRVMHVVSRRDLLLSMGGAFIALLGVSALVNILGSLAAGRFAYATGDRLREVLFAEYLRRDYLFHARAGAARLTDHVLYQSDRVTNAALNAQLLVTNVALTVLVIASIAMVSWAAALVAVCALSASYLLIYRLIRRRVARNGRILSQIGSERVAVVQQAFLGIKYLLVAGAQRPFNQQFAAVTRSMSRTAADTQFIGQLPRYILECVAGTALIGAAALVGGDSVNTAWLAQLSFCAFAGFRLLPAIQQMYSAVVALRANLPAIESLAAELEGSITIASPPQRKVFPTAPAFVHSIELTRVSFRYAPEMPLILEGASLRIVAGSAVGIVGASGCGKTTLVDLITGLLSPQDGTIEVDGAPLAPQRLRAWQQSIGYVPQDVLILDATVRENIAFGVDPREIDDDRLREVARLAGAGEFIEALRGGFAARLSGLGGGLSGGQRQRIGIARALYGDPSFLLLDEATNSLDAGTERAIIDTVVRNRGSRTLLVVAHGAEAIGACDRVYELRNGSLHERESPRAAFRATPLFSDSRVS